MLTGKKMIKTLGQINKYKILNMVLILTIFIAATATVISISPKPAYAVCCSSCCTCIFETIQEDFPDWILTALEINIYIWIKLLIHQFLWFDMTYWEQNVLPVFMNMGNQLAAVGTMQVMIIGQFIDAKQQLETQRLLQELNAQASKEYHPSLGMCEFGTRVISLASSERKGEANALILSERSSDRLLGNVGTGARAGSKDDIAIRLKAFQEEYCNVFDNGFGLEALCPTLTPPQTAVIKNRFNRDIDYQKTVQDPWTIEFDLTAAGVPSENDEEIVAMANNLYGYDTFVRSDFESLKYNVEEGISTAQKAYLNMRSVVAKTKVAENSFNALISMKGEGTAGSRAFIDAYLEELGMPSSEIGQFLGTNPSYNAQMEVLTKKAYQTPMFYTNLYDKPANIARKGVAMQAIGLIQKFDLLKSYLRTEASLSVLLEVSILQLQREVEDNIRAFNQANVLITE